MSKKVLILSGSPRKRGNSDLLCDEFLRGATEAGHTAEKIFVHGKNIHYCTGCGTCYAKERPCPQKDDMNEMMDKMIAADVIVLSTPVYFYTMSAQMKTLIDRTCARYTEMKNKEFYFILTAAETDKQLMNWTIEGFRAFLYCLDEPVEKGIIYGTGAWHAGEIKNTPAFAEAYETGKNL